MDGSETLLAIVGEPIRPTLIAAEVVGRLFEMASGTVLARH
jgi:hypothetical protein